MVDGLTTDHFSFGEIKPMKLQIVISSLLTIVLHLSPVLAQTTKAGACATSPALTDPSAGAHWNGWGAGVTNTRFQSADQARLTAADVPKLKLKWAFGIDNVTQARSQPAIAGGRLFMASDSGAVYALDPKTGCTHWTFKAQTNIRAAISVGQNAIYFADTKANAYAVDRATGAQLWIRKVDDHAFAKSTGAPTLYDGRLYVTASGVGEETSAARPEYQCCTFRGSVSALDANTGVVIWKAYTIPEAPKPRGKSTAGAQLWGPSGAGVWSAPTIDAKRGLIYVATGNGYSDPQQKTSDAVIAFDLKTGRMKWASQVTPKDVWALGCSNRPGQPANPNCPEDVGPDFDFAASPILTTLPNGRDIIVIPQKSGVGYGLDPEKEGEIVWQYRFGRGSAIGGVWGAAVDQQQAYFAAADYLTPAPGGLHAVRLDTGQRVWYTPPPKQPLCAGASVCSTAQSAAVTAIPGVVFSGSADGGIRAYSAKDGSILWEFDTNRSFDTVNGVKAAGGSIDGPGPIVVDGILYMTSGNGGLVGRSGNVLLAFGID
jgi:polyvinyl alcohol dehydrogenase (cytochrome)